MPPTVKRPGRSHSVPIDAGYARRSVPTARLGWRPLPAYPHTLLLNGAYCHG